ncbi:DUF6745 domain-containing protein [Micromonospora sp. NPDC050495]|uniref:DUF6745 domain-containing protein n=1 Tax=Micromonospora sp. NPDC050495 TaxID=3154936 RepID=UPI0033FC3AE3
MTSAIYPMTAPAHAVTDRWTRAALSCKPANHARAEAGARLAYQAAGEAEPARFLWCPSPPAAIEHLQRLLDDGHRPLVGSVRRGNLNRSLTAARAPIWEHTSERDQVTAFGDFHQFMEWTGYYGEQRYDGVEARYDLMEHPYRCNPVTEAERTVLEPVLDTVRRVYDLVHAPIWSTIDRSLTAGYIMRSAWFWDAERSIVDQDDEGHAVVRYCLDPHDWFFEAAWTYYPDWLVLATIDTYQKVFGSAPDAAWEGCRDVALAAGPWWPLTGVAVLTERPTVLRIDAHGRLHAEDEPAVVWPDGSRMWARNGTLLPPP